MKMFKYEVTAIHKNGDEVTMRTNHPRPAMEAYVNASNDGLQVVLNNGTTGEVLSRKNDPTCEDYHTEEFWGMLLDYVAGRM